MVLRRQSHSGKVPTVAPEPPGQRRIGQELGRLTVVLAVVWAATMLAATVAAKASPDFVWVILLMLAGATASGACVEQTRRRLTVTTPA
jgi:hypothetical protein